MTTFLLKRGRGVNRRVAHLARFNAYGEIAGAWCHRQDYNLTSNVPWGQPRCKDCLRRFRGGTTT